MADTNSKDLMQKKEYVEKRLKELGARPVSLSNRRQLIRERALLQVYLLIDCSISMRDFKLEQAKSGAIQYAENACKKGYAVGVISFSGQARLVCKPVKNSMELKKAINNLAIESSTNLTWGLHFAKENFQAPVAGGTIVVVTDGMPDNVQTAVETANQLKRMRIKIFCIGTDDADQDFLEQISSKKKMAIHVEKENFASAIVAAAKQLSSGGNK